MTGIWLARFMHHDLIAYVTISYLRSGAEFPLALFCKVTLQRYFKDFIIIRYLEEQETFITYFLWPSSRIFFKPPTLTACNLAALLPTETQYFFGQI